MDLRQSASLKTSVLTASTFFLGLSVLACEQGPPEITPEEGTYVVQIAEPLAGELLRTLVGRLMGAMEEGGPTQALEFCSTEAIPLTRTVEGGAPRGVALKRTSFRYRNPNNAPDDAEELALRFFEDAILNSGEVPGHYVQRVSEGELRYYKPLFVAQVCLQCHGPRDEMDPEVLEVLDTRYPGDLATGYSAGDLRGVVRVSVPASESSH